MKKVIIYSISILLITIITVGGTYAWFSASVTANNEVSGGSHELKVSYSGAAHLSANLDIAKNKEEGHNRTISIGLEQGSVGATANVYIEIEEITSNLAIEALKWEVYTVKNGVETAFKSGDFEDCGEIGTTKTKCTAGQKIYIVENYVLSTEITNFKVYFWLSGYESDNDVLGGSLSAFIAAETHKITGNLSQ